MTTQEVKCYPYWEFMDLLACLSVYNGTAKQKKKKKKMSVLEALSID